MSKTIEIPDIEVTIQALEEAYAGDSSLDFIRDAAALLRPILAAPAVERQELVAEVYRGPVSGINRMRWLKGDMPPVGTLLYTSPPAQVALTKVTLQHVLKAYDYAESHPHKYLRGTTNWCAAVAHELSACLDKVKEMNK